MILTCDSCPHWQDGMCCNPRSAHYQVSRRKPREICLRRKMDLDTTKPQQAALFAKEEHYATGGPRRS